MIEISTIHPVTQAEATYTNRAQHPVAAYGTIRTGMWNNRVLGRDVASLGIETISGLKMYAMTSDMLKGDYSGIPFVTVSDNPEDTVTVELFQVPVFNWERILSALDFLEGSPDWYVRHKVCTSNGKHIWIYLFTSELANEYITEGRAIRVPTGDWFNPTKEVKFENVKATA